MTLTTASPCTLVTRRFLLTTLLLLCCALPRADAQWWWPFGTRPSGAPAQEQTERSIAIFAQAKDHEAAGRTGAAAGRYEYLFERYPLSDFAAPALFRYAIICFERQEWNDALIGFQRIFLRHPEFREFDRIIEYQFRIALAYARGTDIRWAGVLPYRAHNRAVGVFELILANAPYSDLAPLALMNIALIHDQRGDVLLAIDALDRLINAYPISALADEAYLLLADTYASLVDGPMYDQGATRQAISYYQDYLILFPDGPSVAEGEAGLAEMQDVYAQSKLVLGSYYFRHRKWYEAAQVFFSETVTVAPNSPAADRAREYLDRTEVLIEALERQRAEASAQPEPAPRPRRSFWDRILFWRDPAEPAAPEDAPPLPEPAAAPEAATTPAEEPVRQA